MAQPTETMNVEGVGGSENRFENRDLVAQVEVGEVTSGQAGDWRLVEAFKVTKGQQA